MYVEARVRGQRVEEPSVIFFRPFRNGRATVGPGGEYLDSIIFFGTPSSLGERNLFARLSHGSNEYNVAYVGERVL